jgi:hypothetical protein
MKFSNGVEITNGACYFRGVKIGKYHRCNSNYPPSVTTLGGRQIGCNSDEECAKAILAAAQMEDLGVDLDGNLFPDERWILRINNISMACSPNPDDGVKIMAKVHFNHHSSTGSSQASKPAKHTIMEIDLEAGTFHGKERGKKKEFKFANQDAMVAKLKTHVEERMAEQEAK